MVYVLIVDDDEDDRDLFCDAVNIVDPSIECIMARNGEEALEGSKKQRFSHARYNFFGSKYAAAKWNAMFEER